MQVGQYQEEMKSFLNLRTTVAKTDAYSRLTNLVSLKWEETGRNDGAGSQCKGDEKCY